MKNSMTEDQRASVEMLPGFSRWSPWFNDTVHFSGDPSSFEDDVGYILGPYWEEYYTMVVDIYPKGINPEFRKEFGPIIPPDDIMSITDDEDE